jgi:hypothetical protein
MSEDRVISAVLFLFLHILANKAGLALAVVSRSIVLRMYVFYPERPPETDSHTSY